MVAHPETPDSLASFTWNVTSLSALGMTLHATSSWTSAHRTRRPGDRPWEQPGPQRRRLRQHRAAHALRAPASSRMYVGLGRFGDAGLDLRSAAQVDKRSPTTTLAQVDQIDAPGSFVKIEQSGAVGAQATSLDPGRRRREQLEAQARTCARRRGPAGSG